MRLRQLANCLAPVAPAPKELNPLLIPTGEPHHLRRALATPSKRARAILSLRF